MAAIKSILIIEDDRFIGEMYVRSLRKEGYEVTWVINGSDGAIEATKGTYDLIILDVMLPERQGPEVLSDLRNDQTDKVPHSRILVLTNFDQDDASRLAMQKYADGYMVKADITPRKLLEIIAAMPKAE